MVSATQKVSEMGSKLKVAGWVAAGAVAGALATMQLQATARSALSPMPLEDKQQLAEVFDLVKRSYVEPGDEDRRDQTPPTSRREQAANTHFKSRGKVTT